MNCVAEPENGNMGDKNLAHGKDGFPLLFVDGHCAYTKYTTLRDFIATWIGRWAA
jgi:prepilin-type processing-associated H-X9-DG protein